MIARSTLPNTRTYVTLIGVQHRVLTRTHTNLVERQLAKLRGESAYRTVE
jgi:hypothetical protein